MGEKVDWNENVGKKYGKLTITEFLHLKKNGIPVYSCTCECGYKRLQVSFDRLENGITTDCGCSKRNGDLIGKRFGRLVVVRKTEERKRRSIVWECKCDCGNTFYCAGQRLSSNKIVSCGCKSKEKQHFAHNSSIHKIWDTMLTRCYNKNRRQYYLYGGRGIKVCDEWNSRTGNVKAFSNFYDWAINNGYSEEKEKWGRAKYTLDRIDPDGDYSPTNCRWITNEEQQKNKRADKLFEYNGETKTVKEWLKQYYVKNNDYYRLLFLGYSNKEILDFISKPQQIIINFNHFWLFHKERYKFTEDRKNIIDKFTDKVFDMNRKEFENIRC